MDDLDRDEDKGKDPEDAPPAPNDWPKIGGDKAPAEPDEE